MSEKIKGIWGNSMYPGRVKEWLESQGATDFGDLDFTDVKGVYFVRPDGHAGCIYKIYSFLFEIVELPRWRAEKDILYYYINETMGISFEVDDRTSFDDQMYNCGNYFHTDTEAKMMRDKIVELLKRGNDERED